MRDLDPSVDLYSQPQTVRRGRRGVTPAVLALPLLAVAGILGVAWTFGVEDACGGPVPGCGSLRNAGDIPVTVRAVIDQPDTETLVGGGARALLGGWSNGVRVDRGQCLTVEGGPFWDTLTVIDRTTEATGVWHPVDDWGARVQLHDRPCPESS
ncbi:hypothetical protein C3B59_01220 [Cryobacterium zongtaii]|uniref:Uncharacterized protein n=1 Tax=Cryobacterium zongtaii TaxID=1259217 RepID=A0A2S3ZPV1_9MICO|nr:hypothetical protein [Cryobacterium zongtaii]POH71256.1 hypothetical protein C3B59_01220 [Cryobacterium zongtaii]